MLQYQKPKWLLYYAGPLCVVFNISDQNFSIEWAIHMLRYAPEGEGGQLKHNILQHGGGGVQPGITLWSYYIIKPQYLERFFHKYAEIQDSKYFDKEK